GTNSVGTRLGLGGGALGPLASIGVGSQPNAIVAFDYDGDGDVDLATADDGSGTVTVIRNFGFGALVVAIAPSVGADPRDVAAGDRNGDGVADLVTGNTNAPESNVSVLIGAPGGGFLPDLNVAAGGNPIAVALGDVDGDGDLDIVSANYGSADVSVVPNNGTSL